MESEAAADLLGAPRSEPAAEPAGGNPPLPAPILADHALTGSAARALSTEQAASARATWTRLYPGREAEFDTAIAGTKVVANPSQDIAGPNKADGVSIVTKLQAAAMIEELRAQGVPADKIEEALKRDGSSLSDFLSNRSAELDREFGIGQAAAEDFHVNYGAPGLPVDQLAAFDTEARSWLAGLGISAPLGASIVERAMRVGRQFAAMSQDQRNAWKQSEHRELATRLGGADAVKGAVDLAALAIKRAGPSQFTQALLDSGALNDTWLVQTLAVHGSMVKARQAAK